MSLSYKNKKGGKCRESLNSIAEIFQPIEIRITNVSIFFSQSKL